MYNHAIWYNATNTYRINDTTHTRTNDLRLSVKR